MVEPPVELRVEIADGEDEVAVAFDIEDRIHEVAALRAHINKHQTLPVRGESVRKLYVLAFCQALDRTRAVGRFQVQIVGSVPARRERHLPPVRCPNGVAVPAGSECELGQCLAGEIPNPSVSWSRTSRATRLPSGEMRGNR